MWIMYGLFVFMVGAAGYSIIEILWRGYTHWTMSLTGGICMVWLYFINSRIECNLWLKCILGCIAITCTEFLVGIVVNKILGWAIWDYSDIPFNFKGQICLLYSFLWFLLCFPIFGFCEHLKLMIERF